MESRQVARSMRGSIGMLAMDWLMAPTTTAEAEKRGMAPGGAGYAVGRLGVLGDCPVDNVVGAAFFWEPSLMREMVSDGRAVTSPADGAAIYASICRSWGERCLDRFDGTERLGELCERVVPVGCADVRRLARSTAPRTRTGADVPAVPDDA